MNKTLKVVLGILISLGLIIFLFYKINFNSVLKVLRDFNIKILILLVVIYILGILLRTFRWQLLINQREKSSTVLIFKALIIGYMINNLLPAKVGELARMEYLKRKRNIGRSFLLGTIFTERLLDILLVFSFLVFSLLFSHTSRVVFAHNQWAIYVIAFVIILVIYLMLKPKTIKWFFRFFPNKLKGKLENVTNAFTSAIQFINNKLLLSGLIVYSILIWSLTLLSAYSILRGLGITLPFYAYFFIIAAGVFGMVVPSTSGGIGVYHTIATGALLVFMVKPEKALTYAIISHAFDFFPSIILGLVVSIKDDLLNTIRIKTK